MTKLAKMLFTLALVGLLGQVALVSADEAGDAQARKDKILANLKLTFPQLEQANPTMGAIDASGFAGLDEGSFFVNGRPQKFLVSTDDKKFYLVSGEPIDVSRGPDEIAAEVARKKAEEAKQAAERVATINSAIEGRPMRGNPDAPVTIVEFSDFQCPYCARGATTMEEIVEKYKDDVRFVFKHFPLNFHPWAKPAAIASHCAATQSDDAFWTLHDKFFADQKALNPGNVVEKSKGYLAGSGIDMAKWQECAGDTASESYKAASAAVDADMALGQSLGVTGTPGFFVNGQFLNGAQPINAFEPLIAAAKANS